VNRAKVDGEIKGKKIKKGKKVDGEWGKG